MVTVTVLCEVGTKCLDTVWMDVTSQWLLHFAIRSNMQKLAFVHRVHLCVLYDFHDKQRLNSSRPNRLTFVTEKHRVYCKTGT